MRILRLASLAMMQSSMPSLVMVATTTQLLAMSVEVAVAVKKASLWTELATIAVVLFLLSSSSVLASSVVLYCRIVLYQIGDLFSCVEYRSPVPTPRTVLRSATVECIGEGDSCAVGIGKVASIQSWRTHEFLWQGFTSTVWIRWFI